jgi:hypothetical protein
MIFELLITIKKIYLINSEHHTMIGSSKWRKTQFYVLHYGSFNIPSLATQYYIVKFNQLKYSTDMIY